MAKRTGARPLSYDMTPLQKDYLTQRERESSAVSPQMAKFAFRCLGNHRAGFRHGNTVAIATDRDAAVVKRHRNMARKITGVKRGDQWIVRAAKRPLGQQNKLDALPQHSLQCCHIGVVQINADPRQGGKWQS